MIFLKKNIDSISISESNFVFKLKGYKNNVEIDFVEIKNIFIGFKKVTAFYFFDIISFIIVLVSLALTYWCSSNDFFLGGIVLVFLRGVYLVNNSTYFVTVKLKNGTSFNFYFSHFIRNTIIEKIKIIRGIITGINFNLEKEKKRFEL